MRYIVGIEGSEDVGLKYNRDYLIFIFIGKRRRYYEQFCNYDYVVGIQVSKDIVFIDVIYRDFIFLYFRDNFSLTL